MAPSRRGWQQRRRRRAVRTDRPGAGCSAFTLRAGSALPLRARRASRAAPSPAGGGSGPAHGSAQAGPEARLRAAAWSRPGWSCGTRRGAGHGVGRPALPKAGGGRRAGRERAALEERDSGQEGRGARPRDGAPRPCAPATESARAAPLGTARLPEPSLASPAARSRRKLAPWDRAGCGRGRAAGRGSAEARPHSLTMPSCGFRGGGGGQAAARRERSGPSERARSCRLAACTGAGACARGARETHALTLPHTRERCEGRGGRGGQSLTTAHVYMPEGGGVLFFASLLSRHLKLRFTKAQDTSLSAQRITQAKSGPGAGRECALWSGPAKDQTSPAFARVYSPGGGSHPTRVLGCALPELELGFLQDFASL